jgi:CarD family transcriptional regulator, regulator of rRNA transcription
VVFDVGAKVIYPGHGVAEVVAHEVQMVDGETRMYLVLSILHGGWGPRGQLKVSVPEDRAESIGVRPAISLDDADDVLVLLATTDVHVPANWSRRLKNHQEKLRSGDVYQCAEVVRNLSVRQRDTALAPAEVGMYARARQSLISELAVSWGLEHDEAEVRVDDALRPLAAGSPTPP